MKDKNENILKELDKNCLATTTMSMQEYQSDTAISRSALLNITRSPYYFRYMQSKEKEVTPNMLLGTYLHDVLMFPDHDKNYVIEPTFDRRTKGGKADYKQFLVDNQDKTILPKKINNQDTIMICEKIKKNFKQNSFLQKIIKSEKFLKEVSVFWEDETTGVKCKCRPDILGWDKDNNIAYLFDIKTCQSAYEKDFRYDIKKHKYHVQLSFYAEGIKKVLGVNQVICALIAIETQEPWDCAIYEITEETVQLSEEVWKEALQQYKECSVKNEWPGYPQKAQSIQLAPWEI
jgi:exodeoxyribonuclease VIII